MKAPSNSWEEHLKSRLDDHESPVPDAVFHATMKKREQRKWLNMLRKKSRHLWLLLLLLIPFTCNYFGNKTSSVVTTPLKEKATVSSNTSSEKTSTAVVSRGMENISTANKKETIQTVKKGNESQTDKIDRNTNDKTGSGLVTTFHSADNSGITSGLSEKQKRKTGAFAAATLAEVHEPFLHQDNPSENNFDQPVSFYEEPVMAGLPGKESIYYFENKSSIEKISMDKVIEGNTIAASEDSSAAAIEISPTSWKMHWSAEAFFSPDLSFQQLKDQPDDSLTLTGWNSQMEKSYTTGIRFSLNLVEGLFLKTGLTYSKEQSAFTFEKGFAVPVMLDSTYYYTIWSPFKEPVYVFYSDTTIELKDSIAAYASSLTYSYWNIPLLLGYTFDMHRFHLGVQSGVIFNAKFARKLSGIDPQTLEPVSLPENNSQMFRDHASVSFYAGVENEFRFNDHFGIFAEPYFQVQLKPITTEAAPVEQRLYQFGLNTGIKYSF